MHDEVNISPVPADKGFEFKYQLEWNISADLAGH